MDTIKKIVSYILIACVLLFTIIAILGIWDIIDLRNIMMKSLFSLIILFAASAIILFIYTVFMKDTDQRNP
jgi:hypothetical protein